MTPRPTTLGLRENAAQFSLLVAVTAFVGAMVGLERTVLPLIGSEDFGLASTAAVLSFIVAFGIAKALTNLAAGALADRLGRRRLLILGWSLALPIPLLIALAPSWEWVIAANVLLGVNQGLAWSMTVVMKIDLVGPARRGFALGLNEAAGYGGVALAAAVSGWVAAGLGAREVLVGAGVVVAVAGLALSVAFVRDTAAHVELEQSGGAGASLARQAAEPGLAARDAADRGRAAQGTAAGVRAGGAPAGGPRAPAPPRLRTAFAEASWRSPTLRSCSQAGLVNNLNDALAWGLIPLFLASEGASIGEVGLVAGIYPAVWGLGQIWTGHWSDTVGRKLPIVAGMLLQAAALGALALSGGDAVAAAASAALLGVGTALVYPTLIAAISDAVEPVSRATTVGVYRFWRDSGYVAGGLLAGGLADALGFGGAIAVVAAVTAGSGLWLAFDMPGWPRVASASDPVAGPSPL